MRFMGVGLAAGTIDSNSGVLRAHFMGEKFKPGSVSAATEYH